MSQGSSVAKTAITDTLGVGLNSSGAGYLKVTDEPTQLFYDPFDGTLDTTNVWAVASGNSGVAPTSASGSMTMGTGTVANGYSKLTSIPTFKPAIPAWLAYSDAISIPDAAAPTANALRMWGLGTTPATPTLAAPINDGYFFELNGSVLSAVVYNAGTRTQIATGLTLATGLQRYIIQVRTDRTFFYIGTIDNNGLVGVTNFQSPNVQILPKMFLAVGGATAPAANAQISCTGAVVGDTGKNACQIADATFPWRKAQVSAAGALSTTTKSSVVQQQASSLTALNQAQTFTLQGEAGMSVQLTGTWTATVTFEASNDNTNWTTINVQRAGDNVISQTVINSTNNDVYRVGISGFLYVRIRCSAFTSGTIVVTSATSLAASTAVLSAALPAGQAQIGAVSIAPASLIVSVTAGAGTAVTATLPAAGAGLFHYITRINIIKYASAALAGSATPTVVTTTNLPGSLAWTTPTALAIGTNYETDIQSTSPIKATAANTATTIVCPLVTSLIWRVNVYYYTAP